MIAGIGVDIVSIARIARMLDLHGEHFARRLLAESELADYRAAPAPAAFMAKRFAAKEAFGKALGTGIAQGVTLPQIAVRHDAAGRPWLELSGAAAEHLARRGIVAWHLSLADEQEHAVAMVVLEQAAAS
ncbi:holo-ACP synthase [Immundisolibacter sp.]|uniref:holo-ACP synthase n=1 Tax=Immundisolibacter sp. TaxID=1934948 RepID=UPI00260EAF59|nr:holo-ACP synthase [Immundisolibacter sp.]MDD3650647.1 holo-ACP synthase [Immundisolibacter sp.]